jgi:hypothetical protein
MVVDRTESLPQLQRAMAMSRNAPFAKAHGENKAEDWTEDVLAFAGSQSGSFTQGGRNCLSYQTFLPVGREAFPSDSLIFTTAGQEIWRRFRVDGRGETVAVEANSKLPMNFEVAPNLIKGTIRF